ncbi:helix-turn-helix domain-containing protein [Loigolactobacillus rennini]|uniref:Helix-turn-helix domain-containing protein n=1 Tax=Loigolactobacillus rennini DSM 20253 TaxID=1423796 RepID=A0A0R2CQ52_9LACO|nr:helix-turn-helix domain-containing protein [Loigolactobacillus rennini]KRM93370.1 hypothetical protein FC24_GL000458 [Loigolactobacillus rennini DSM 20253]
MEIQFLSDEMQNEIKQSIIDLAQATFEKASNQRVPQFMNKKTAAKYLNVSQVTFDKWTVNKELPEIRIDGCIRYDRNDLDKFMLSFKN